MPSPDGKTELIGADPTAALLAETCMRLNIKNRVLERLLHLFSNLAAVEQVREGILNAATDAIPAEGSSLLEVDLTDGSMTFTAARGPVSEKIKGIRLEPGTGIAGACVLERKILAVSDVSRDPRFAEEIQQKLGFSTRSLLAAPVIWHGDVIGVIEVVNKLGEDTFQWYEHELMERIGRAAATLLQLARERA